MLALHIGGPGLVPVDPKLEMTPPGYDLPSTHKSKTRYSSLGIHSAIMIFSSVNGLIRLTGFLPSTVSLSPLSQQWEDRRDAPGSTETERPGPKPMLIGELPLPFILHKYNKVRKPSCFGLCRRLLSAMIMSSYAEQYDSEWLAIISSCPWQHGWEYRGWW